MPIDPSDAEQVAPALLAYLRDRLGLPGLALAEAPEEVTYGLTTYTYFFRLAGPGLDGEWAAPLVLRVFPFPDQAPQAEREAAAQRFAADSGYPAPRPLAVETANDALARPFIVMERLPGVTMLDKLGANLGANLGAATRLMEKMADLHVALHRLPFEDGSLTYEGPLIERALPAYREQIESFGLRALEEPYSWLEQHRDMVLPEELSFCHNDFHPFNLVVDDDERVGVVDWQNAGIGDRHLDVAWPLVLMRTASPEPRKLAERLIAPIARRFITPHFVRKYLARYQDQIDLDPDRLRYWEAFRAFGMWARIEDPRAAGGMFVAQKQRPEDRFDGGFPGRLKRYFWARANAS